MDAWTQPGRPRTPGDPLLLRVAAAAEPMAISRSHAYQLARTGRLPGVVRLGGSLRVSVRGLEEWIAAQRQVEHVATEADVATG